MNQKTAKLLKKYGQLKGLSEKNLKREWMSMNKMEKSKKRKEYLSILEKK
ncbi:MAG: hypothetical protein H7A23_04035 [Leptospiraceae bacterium]|nr:hypothetical protein [Leptospiraceae bacterium]MCP5493701.1 hypothetical protein [Leptospiraceae bacterium]